MTEEMGGGAEGWCVVDGAAESAAEEWFGVAGGGIKSWI